VPELPEIETIRASLEPHVVGARVESVEVRCSLLRRPVAGDFSARLEGQTIVALRRRAKYLLLDLDGGQTWIVHLGMSGRLLLYEANSQREPAKHDHVIASLDGDRALVFNDPRRFGLMVIDDAGSSQLLAGIGPEPLDADAFSGAYLSVFRRTTGREIKSVLMDQRVVAGLGNIYVNEILFASRVRPRRRMSRLSLAECETITEATRSVLAEAIEHRGTTLSDFLDGIGRRGGYQWRRRVYDRAGEPCPRCATTIKSVVVAQRSSFYCPRCQR